MDSYLVICRRKTGQLACDSVNEVLEELLQEKEREACMQRRQASGQEDGEVNGGRKTLPVFVSLGCCWVSCWLSGEATGGG